MVFLRGVYHYMELAMLRYEMITEGCDGKAWKDSHCTEGVYYFVTFHMSKATLWLFQY